jgi:N-acyl-D-amino-acid deacylase
LIDGKPVLIRGGLVYDGSPGAPRACDVLIRGDRIAKVAPGISEPAAHEVDARGCVVCPGFVDIHRHLDARPFTDWRGEAELRQGITTAVAGNCGFSLAPMGALTDQLRAHLEPILGLLPEAVPAGFPSYLRALDRAAKPLNLAAMVGTGSVRIAVKGFAAGSWTAEEMARAQAMIEEALDAGACGVSLGIMYVPECYAGREEFARLLRPLGERGGVCAVHIRGEGDSLVDSVKEAVDIARLAGCALHISHFKSCGVDNWRREIHKAIDVMDAARDAGLDLTCDFYPYTGGSTALTTMLPPDYIAGDLAGALWRLGTERGVAAFRDSISRLYPGWDNFALTLGWERVIISSVRHAHNRRYLGMTVADAALRFGFPDAAALAAHLMHDEAGATAIINMSMCQDDVDTVAGLPYAMVVSDAIYAQTDTPHPRMFGAQPRILREYVRERGVLSMQQAIHKMTAMPARRMGLAGRGELKEGFFADVLVFDPEQFRDNAVFGDSAKPATGLQWAFVNGVPAVRDDALLAQGAGRLLRRRYNRQERA